VIGLKITAEQIAEVAAKMITARDQLNSAIAAFESAVGIKLDKERAQKESA
jgi:hypothetical protein